MKKYLNRIYTILLIILCVVLCVLQIQAGTLLSTGMVCSLLGRQLKK